MSHGGWIVAAACPAGSVFAVRGRGGRHQKFLPWHDQGLGSRFSTSAVWCDKLGTAFTALSFMAGEAPWSSDQSLDLLLTRIDCWCLGSFARHQLLSWEASLRGFHFGHWILASFLIKEGSSTLSHIRWLPSSVEGSLVTRTQSSWMNGFLGVNGWEVACPDPGSSYMLIFNWGSKHFPSGNHWW